MKERAYDSFLERSTQLDPSRWEIVRMRDQNGTVHEYRDRNARVRAGDGRLNISVLPFTRFHDTDPMGNNAKLLCLSTEHFKAPPGLELIFEVDMAVTTNGQVPFDLLDAFGTANLVDFATGTVINMAATNDTVYAVHERLAVPRGTGENQFTHRIVLDVATRPGQQHRYSLAYRSDTGGFTWFVDGEPHYWAVAPARPTGFQVGMGLFSARSLTQFSRAEREHGQGAAGQWGPWRISLRELSYG
ncbi:DUF6081 family protein [Phytoactinopolyspora limicola]|uniref:DUF6081 family protein n=1 Tax=Phytoactinopolyspora limicola TaxID=2715536 RepID=UPI001A9C62EE|nr:DUF6081 family protein [Phytoactinopolyspora limicola]